MRSTLQSISESLSSRFSGSRSKRNNRIGHFKFESTDPAVIRQDIEQKFDHDSELLDLFVGNQGVVVHKWHHYIPLYDRYFSEFRSRPVKILEIGVSNGGSLQMWRNYFGEEATIFGIDIDPNCASLNGIAGQVRIGSQTDVGFLQSVVEEMGGIDIVLDDGSHHMAHIPVTLEFLYPQLSHGGIYMIEDLHTSYWKRFGGGYQVRGNFFKYAMDIVDDMHHWYHNTRLKHAMVSAECSGVHIHDSIVVLEKNKVYKPVHSRIGQT